MVKAAHFTFFPPQKEAISGIHHQHKQNTNETKRNDRTNERKKMFIFHFFFLYFCTYFVWFRFMIDYSLFLSLSFSISWSMMMRCYVNFGRWKLFISNYPLFLSPYITTTLLYGISFRLKKKALPI